MAANLKLSGWVVIPIVLIVWGGFALFDLSSDEPIQDETQELSHAISELEDGELNLGQVAPGSADEIFVCRAAIAEIMGREIRIIKGVRRSDGNVGTSYKRPSDGVLWQNLCKVEANSVIWASLENSGRVGRWRTHAGDEKITYDLKGNTVTIFQRFSDGTSLQDSFDRDSQ